MKRGGIMKNFIMGLIIGIIFGAIFTIFNIRVDGVNELDNGIITLKIWCNYFDYEYETTKGVE